MSDEVAVSDFMARVLERVAQLAADKARPLIPSHTLADAMTIVAQDAPHSVALEIPHYWAVYVHDGRGAFGPVKATYLVWWRDRLQDPRTGFGTNYPVREADIRRLSREQFAFGLELNREARKRGEPVPMIVAKFNPRILQGVPFFSQGLANFSSDAAPVVHELFAEFLSDVLPPDEKDEARLVL